jgi:serine/threonine protein kinase
LKVNPVVWSKLTEDAKGLITALLNKNPKDRITARDALKHTFITSHHLGAHRRGMHSMNVSDLHGFHDLSNSTKSPVATTPLGQNGQQGFNGRDRNDSVTSKPPMHHPHNPAHGHPPNAQHARQESIHSEQLAGVADVSDSDASSVVSDTPSSKSGKGLSVSISDKVDNIIPAAHHTPPPTSSTILPPTQQQQQATAQTA